MISIREDDKDERQLFYSIQQASDKTGIPSEVIDEVLQRKFSSGRYFRRTDKKTFWIEDEGQGMPFIRIGQEDFPNVDSVLERFGLPRDDAIYQLCQERLGQERTGNLYDSQGKSHYIMWKSPSLRVLVNALKQAQIAEKALDSLPPNGAHEKARSLVEEIENLF